MTILNRALVLFLLAVISFQTIAQAGTPAEPVLDFLTAVDGTLDSRDDLQQAGLHDSGTEPAEASASGVTSAPLAAGEPLARSIAGEPEAGLDEAEEQAAAGPGTCCIYFRWDGERGARFGCSEHKCIGADRSCPTRFQACPLDRFYSVPDCASCP